MILMLQSRTTWKVAELATELRVSERTVHRYLSMLEDMGIPLYSERGPYGGFSLMRGYRLPPLIFTAEEATVLYMGANLVAEVWGQTYKDAVTAVTAKLDNVLPDDLRQDVSRAQQSLVISGLSAKDFRPWEPMIHALRENIAQRRRVLLRYRGFSLAETQREVDPYALSFHSGLWYLVGYCHLRRALRTFRLDRIQDISRLDDRFTFPRDFNAREYITRTMQFEDRFTVVVHLNAIVAPFVREHHGHWMDLTDHPDGSVTARFGISDLDWATGWVLSYGPAAKVLSPLDLATRVQDAASALLQRYQPTERSATAPS
jgi:predicted DNA-binding transcriptional regulator YafY